MRTRRTTEMEIQEYSPDGGPTRPVEVPIKVETPIIRDWDAIALRGAYVAVLVLVTGAMIWSTVSIGSMLSSMAPAWTAYMIASIFDAAWIVCLTLEFLSRFNPKKVTLPRGMGWVALAVSMAAIATHGSMSGHLVVGLFGAIVSAIAKGLWAMLMHHSAAELSPVQQAWVSGEISDLTATRAVLGARRSMARTKHQIALEAAALAADEPPVILVERQPEPVAVKSDPVKKKLKKAKREAETLRRRLEETRSSPVISPPLSSVPVTSSSGASGPPEQVPLKKVVTDFLASGTDPKDVIDRVMEVRPGSKPDSIRRTLSTVLREGGYL